MKPETINKLCCPFDKDELELTTIVKDIDERVIEGYFVCKKCARLYPIVKGIPIMNPDQYRDFKLEQPLLNRWKESLKGKTVNYFMLGEGPE